MNREKPGILIHEEHHLEGTSRSPASFAHPFDSCLFPRLINQRAKESFPTLNRSIKIYCASLGGIVAKVFQFCALEDGNGRFERLGKNDHGRGMDTEESWL